MRAKRITTWTQDMGAAVFWIYTLRLMGLCGIFAAKLFKKDGLLLEANCTLVIEMRLKCVRFSGARKALYISPGMISFTMATCVGGGGRM